MLANYGFDMSNVVTVLKQGYMASMINFMIAMLHGLFYLTDNDSEQERKLYEVRTRKILTYSNVVASSANLSIVAITKDMQKLDIGGLIVSINRLITDSKFIKEVKEEFVFGNYKQMILDDSGE